MTHAEKRSYLIKTLLAEQPRYGTVGIPADEKGQKDLLRSLMNVRLPAPVSDEYIGIESEYLKEETAAKGITH
ncbi:MAG: protein-ADP-ribose hydrolase, partial [Clostridia bacterium]|nr:protein-ADP-ribose hydrolase [Clostridia bacterium]